MNSPLLEAGSAAPVPAPVVITAHGVSKRFVVRKDNALKERLVTLGKMGRQHRQEFWALRDIDITIEAGTTVGLIGHNGSGKSTLLKVIGGIIQPTTGTVSRRGRMAALLELGAGFHPDLTGRENVFLNASILGLTRAETEDRFDDILTFSGIGDFIDTQVKFYSSGMYVRLAFSVAVHTEPDVLLVDEVLAVGDEAFQRKCLDKIRSFQAEGRTIILVSHSLGQVTELCDRAILLNRGEIEFDGNAHQAVMAFRNILEERRVEEAAAASPDVVVHEGHVLGATVHAVGKAIGDPVLPGDDLRIVMTFDHDDELNGWIGALQIDNASGQVVYGTKNSLMDVRLPPLSGPLSLEYTIRNVAFGAGKYFVNASLLDSTLRHVHDMPQACTFNVPFYPLATGTVHAEPTLRILDAAEHEAPAV